MAGHDKGMGRIRLNGGDLRQMLAMGATLLEENVELVNALNVFPVPDGDTGTNMVLTMQSALAETAKVTSSDIGAVAHAAAHGALMGARGNSGVILSQILRGIARSADGKEALKAAEFAAALKEGANTAYRGIGRPVEGTILTVARESADAAVAASQQGRSLVQMMRRTTEAARLSLEATPTLLDTLREAGVVDAGGQGYLLILQGAQMFLTGERTPAPIAQARRSEAEATATAESTREYGYCTELLISGGSLDPDKIREQMERMGTSVIVVGEPELIHIHVHTDRPGEILNVASTMGRMDKIKVENMQLQHTSYLASQTRESPRVSGIGVVVVSAGAGMAKLFMDLGACAIVQGGQTMNPSIEEIVHAANSCGREHVILLPNNSNVILTAQQAQAVVSASVKVVSTRTLCEGVAAMVAFNAAGDLEENADAMKEAAEAIQTIEVTRAVRSTRVNGLAVREGQAIGLLDGALVEAGESVAAVAVGTLRKARVDQHEVVTVYVGEGVARHESSDLAASIAREWRNVQVDVIDGGQPHYPYLISVE